MKLTRREALKRIAVGIVAGKLTPVSNIRGEVAQMKAAMAPHYGPYEIFLIPMSPEVKAAIEELDRITTPKWWPEEGSDGEATPEKC